MRAETFKKINELKKEYGVKGKATGPFGKIIQKILALCFYEIGYTNIVERGVQGADIDVTKKDNGKYTIEVKTTESTSIHLTKDNKEAIKDRVKDGYEPVIAILQLSLLDNWRFMRIPINEIPIGKILIDRLRTYKFRLLEDQINLVFDRVMKKHFSEILKGGEKYLKNQLRQSGILLKEEKKYNF